MMVKEEIHFSKFQAIVKLTLRHKVVLGQIYLTELKSKEFTELIRKAMETEFLELVKKSHYLSLLLDGSTDIVMLKRSWSMLFLLKNDRTVTAKLMAMRDVKHDHAIGLTELLLNILKDSGIDLNKKLVQVGYCADGVSVNKGRTDGVAARLKTEIPAPWLVVIHCVVLTTGLSSLSEIPSKEHMPTRWLKCFWLFICCMKQVTSVCVS